MATIVSARRGVEQSGEILASLPHRNRGAAAVDPRHQKRPDLIRSSGASG